VRCLLEWHQLTQKRHYLVIIGHMVSALHRSIGSVTYYVISVNKYERY